MFYSQALNSDQFFIEQKYFEARTNNNKKKILMLLVINEMCASGL